jgi:hypothetical protein
VSSEFQIEAGLKIAIKIIERKEDEGLKIDSLSLWLAFRPLTRGLLERLLFLIITDLHQVIGVRAPSHSAYQQAYERHTEKRHHSAL